ncbi:hypothetical protein B0H13DRAFT_1935751 [Mycena leptocephala]|nr:hypothetical protein B0H13DRAFT_1935751 [Mycena leptocephala]
MAAAQSAAAAGLMHVQLGVDSTCGRRASFSPPSTTSPQSRRPRYLAMSQPSLAADNNTCPWCFATLRIQWCNKGLNKEKAYLVCSYHLHSVNLLCRQHDQHPDVLSAVPLRRQLSIDTHDPATMSQRQRCEVNVPPPACCRQLPSPLAASRTESSVGGFSPSFLSALDGITQQQSFGWDYRPVLQQAVKFWIPSWPEGPRIREMSRMDVDFTMENFVNEHKVQSIELRFWTQGNWNGLGFSSCTAPFSTPEARFQKEDRQKRRGRQGQR